VLSNDKVVSAWVNKRCAKSKNLSSDGASLWSYGCYEVARHIDASSKENAPNVVLIRHRSLVRSKTTAEHTRITDQAVTHDTYFRHLRSFPAPGALGNDDVLGEPNWKWLSWCEWFSRTRRFHAVSGSKEAFDNIAFRISARFPGNTVLSQLRDNEERFSLTFLYPESEGICQIAIPIIKEERRVTYVGRVNRTSALSCKDWEHQTVALNDLLNFAELPGALMASVKRGRDSWKSVLFPGVVPDDVRDRLGIPKAKATSV